MEACRRSPPCSNDKGTTKNNNKNIIALLRKIILKKPEHCEYDDFTAKQR